MDNLRVGGNNTEPVNEVVFRAPEDRVKTVAEEFTSEIKPFGGVSEDEVNKNIGGSAITSGELFTAAPAPNVPGITSVEQNNEMQTGEIGPSLGMGTTEQNNSEAAGAESRIKSLAEDGTTEKRSKVSFRLFDGDTISKGLKAKIDQKIEKNEAHPFELSNDRDREMVEYLRDEYGRIFADDGNKNMGGSKVV